MHGSDHKTQGGQRAQPGTFLRERLLVLQNQ